MLPLGLSTASGSHRILVMNSMTSRPSVSATTSSSSRSSLTSSDSARELAGNARVPQVWFDDQEVGFRSQNTTVSNLVMSVEALIIASDSICSSTRSKYNSMFRCFVSYG